MTCTGANIASCEMLVTLREREREREKLKRSRTQEVNEKEQGKKIDSSGLEELKKGVKRN